MYRPVCCRRHLSAAWPQCLHIHKSISSVFSDVNAVLMLLYCPGNFAETYSDERFSFKPMRCFEI